MRKFVYLQTTDYEMEADHQTTSLDESVDKALKVLGNKGWELVSALYEHDESLDGKPFFYKKLYFKKEKK